MGVIKSSRTLFFTTSPRSPKKLIPEIALLVIISLDKHGAATSRYKKNLLVRLLLQLHLKEIPLRSTLPLAHEIVLLDLRKAWALLIYPQQFS